MGLETGGNDQSANWFRHHIAKFFSGDYPAGKSFADDARWNKIFHLDSNDTKERILTSRHQDEDVFEKAFSNYLASVTVNGKPLTEETTIARDELSYDPDQVKSIWAADTQNLSLLTTIKYKFIEACNLFVYWRTLVWTGNKYPICEWIPTAEASVKPTGPIDIDTQGPDAIKKAGLEGKVLLLKSLRRPNRVLQWGAIDRSKDAYQYKAECRPMAVMDDKRSMGWSWFNREILTFLSRYMMSVHSEMITDQDKDDPARTTWINGDNNDFTKGEYAQWLQYVEGFEDYDYHAFINKLLKFRVGLGQVKSPPKDEEMPINADAYMSKVFSYMFQNYNRTLRLEFGNLAEFKAYMTFELISAIVMQDMVAEEMSWEAVIITNRDLRFAWQSFTDVNKCDLEDVGTKDDHWDPMPRNVLADPSTGGADLLWPCAWTRNQGKVMTFEFIDKKMPPEWASVKLENNAIAGDAYTSKHTEEMYVKWDISSSDALHHELPLPTNTALFWSFGANIGLVSPEGARKDRKINLMFSYLTGSLNVGKRGYFAPNLNLVYKPMLLNTLYSKIPFASMEQPEMKLPERKIGDTVSTAAQPTQPGAPAVTIAPEPIATPPGQGK
jgi:hypothetical protein